MGDRRAQRTKALFRLIAWGVSPGWREQPGEIRNSQAMGLVSG